MYKASAANWSERLASFYRAHPLRLHIVALIVLKIIGLILIRHYFFGAELRPSIDDNAAANKLLQTPAMNSPLNREKVHGI